MTRNGRRQSGNVAGAARFEHGAQPSTGRRVGGHRDVAGRGRRVGNHGRAPCGRQRGRGLAGEHAGDRGGAGGPDPDVRPHFRGALQSRRVDRRCVTGRPALAAGRRVCRRADLGAFIGVAIADVMFGEPVYAWSQHTRSGFPQILSETVATFGLLSVIWGCARRRPDAVPFAVGAYITAAYWFTASTSFANPAVTLARAATNTFAGIRPGDVPGFLLGQAVGAAAATALFRWLLPALPAVADRSSCRTTASEAR